MFYKCIIVSNWRHGNKTQQQQAFDCLSSYTHHFNMGIFWGIPFPLLVLGNAQFLFAITLRHNPKPTKYLESISRRKQPVQTELSHIVVVCAAHHAVSWIESRMWWPLLLRFAVKWAINSICNATTNANDILRLPTSSSGGDSSGMLRGKLMWIFGGV